MYAVHNLYIVDVYGRCSYAFELRLHVQCMLFTTFILSMSTVVVAMPLSLDCMCNVCCAQPLYCRCLRSCSYAFELRLHVQCMLCTTFMLSMSTVVVAMPLSLDCMCSVCCASPSFLQLASTYPIDRLFS